MQARLCQKRKTWESARKWVKTQMREKYFILKDMNLYDHNEILQVNEV